MARIFELVGFSMIVLGLLKNINNAAIVFVFSLDYSGELWEMKSILNRAIKLKLVKMGETGITDTMIGDCWKKISINSRKREDWPILLELNFAK